MRIIPIEKRFLKLGGGAVLLLWALTLSPFGMNRQKTESLEPLSYILPLWSKQMSEDYTKDGVLFSPKDGELLGVMAKDELRSGSLCLRRRLQFPFNIPMTWFKIDLKTH